MGLEVFTVRKMARGAGKAGRRRREKGSKGGRGRQEARERRAKVPGRDRAVRAAARLVSGTLGQGGVPGNSIPK